MLKGVQQSEVHAILPEKDSKKSLCFPLSLENNVTTSFLVVFLVTYFTSGFKYIDMSLTPSYFTNWKGNSWLATLKANN